MISMMPVNSATPSAHPSKILATGSSQNPKENHHLLDYLCSLSQHLHYSRHLKSTKAGPPLLSKPAGVTAALSLPGAVNTQSLLLEKPFF